MPEVSTRVRPGQGHEHVRTSCGREVTVGRLDLGDARHAIRRIFLDLGGCAGCDGTGWASLTATEARQVARALLAEAAAAEQDTGTDGEPAGHVVVRHVAGDVYAISVRGHSVLVDQPVGDGGQDSAATPTELLAGSLASCVAFYAGRYLLRHGLDRAGLAVTADFTMAGDRPARVSGVRLRISVPGASRRSAGTPCLPLPRTAPCTTPCARNRGSASSSIPDRSGAAAGGGHASGPPEEDATACAGG
jgi:putative redox protein